MAFTNLFLPRSIQVAFFIVLVDLWDEAGTRENNLVRVPLPTGITARRYKVQRADSLPASQRQNGTVRIDLGSIF